MTRRSWAIRSETGSVPDACAYMTLVGERTPVWCGWPKEAHAADTPLVVVGGHPLAPLSDKLRESGITLALDGDMVRVRGPKKAIERYKPEIAAAKPEVVAALKAQPRPLPGRVIDHEFLPLTSRPAELDDPARRPL